MCGHVGIAGKLETKDEATMKRLLIFDFFRGPDSTGFAALRNNGETKIAKVASHPIDLFDMKRFTEALNAFQSSVFLGHNRLATKGKVNGQNAHPYEFGDIIGAHNGTLTAKDWSDLEDALGEKFEVDSMALIAHIAKFGIEETIPKLTQGKSTHDGSAWALVWFDKSDKTLNFIRNNQRPFWYSYSKAFDKIIWASEYPTIHAAVEMSTVKYELFQTECEGHFRFFATKENWWYKIELDKLKAGAAARPKPRVKELKGKEPVVTTYTSTYNAGDPFHRRGGTNTGAATVTNGATENSTTSSLGLGNVTHLLEHKKGKDAISVLHVKGSRSEPFGGFITEEEFEKIAKYGCAWCQADVEFREPGVQVYKAQDMVLCPKCAGGDETSRLYVDSIAC